MTDNIILLTDSYKTSHSVQYPPGTTNVYSYLESRGSDILNQVFKSPIDAPFKQSKRGRVTLIKTLGAHGVGYTSGLATTSNREEEALQIVFEDGELVFEDTFSEIRRRAAYYS